MLCKSTDCLARGALLAGSALLASAKVPVAVEGTLAVHIDGLALLAAVAGEDAAMKRARELASNSFTRKIAGDTFGLTESTAV